MFFSRNANDSCISTATEEMLGLLPSEHHHGSNVGQETVTHLNISETKFASTTQDVVARSAIMLQRAR